MNDIVERLRTESPSYVLIGEAAVEIEQLREQVKSLRDECRGLENAINRMLND